MGTLKTTTKILSWICYILIFLYAIVEIPIIFKYRPLVVLSGSMEPTYKVGSVIYYKEAKKEDLKTGDVITFKILDEDFITHRINRIVNDTYETKGDANNQPDPVKIEYENIHGKVTDLKIPYIGYYINFVNNNLYLVIVVVIILLSEFLLTNTKIFDINTKKERSKNK